MHLLHTQTLELTEFLHEDVPPYAVLSHTWDVEEVLFQDMTLMERSTIQLKQGYHKVQAACRLALADGLDWIWVDTCCIDKSSSAELNGAINSMWTWYQGSSVYYVYLSDVEKGQDRHDFRQSRWFTRGWTLAELLAPQKCRFYDQTWSFIGDRVSLREDISVTTNIDEAFLQGPDVARSASTPEKMRWLARRLTTRTEDISYCMLGLFKINMPVLYGEGLDAFRRLQGEI